jgi:hypothetical protein
MIVVLSALWDGSSTSYCENHRKLKDIHNESLRDSAMVRTFVGATNEILHSTNGFQLSETWFSLNVEEGIFTYRYKNKSRLP